MAAQLREERRANDENRRLLAAALERIPAIEPPREQARGSDLSAEGAAKGDATEDPDAPEEPASRPWWRRIFE